MDIGRIMRFETGMAGRLEDLKRWASQMKRDVVALWLAARDPRVPVAAKAVAALVAGYALSPIDLIPDVIPVIGLLDDLIIVPAGIALAVRLIPGTVLADLRAQAEKRNRPVSVLGAVVVALAWTALAAAAALLFLG